MVAPSKLQSSAEVLRVLGLAVDGVPLISSFAPIVRLGEAICAAALATKENAEDMKALALHCADVTTIVVERSQNADNSSENGVEKLQSLLQDIYLFIFKASIHKTKWARVRAVFLSKETKKEIGDYRRRLDEVITMFTAGQAVEIRRGVQTTHSILHSIDERINELSNSQRLASQQTEHEAHARYVLKLSDESKESLFSVQIYAKLFKELFTAFSESLSFVQRFNRSCSLAVRLAEKSGSNGSNLAVFFFLLYLD